MKWNDIKVIAFDLDGTLVNSITDLCCAANYIRQLNDLDPLNESTLATYVGDGIGQLVHRALSDDKNGQVGEEIWSKNFIEFIQYYKEHITEHTRAYKGVESALNLFATKKIPLVVITNKNEILATQLLKNLQLDHYFSLIIGGDTLTEKKPSGLPLLHVAEMLAINCKNLLMVGDSGNDILAAKAAHAMSCGVTWGYGDMNQLSKKMETKPDIIIDDLAFIYDGLQNHAKIEIKK